jgi:hypothetical protein
MRSLAAMVLPTLDNGRADGHWNLFPRAAPGQTSSSQKAVQRHTSFDSDKLAGGCSRPDSTVVWTLPFTGKRIPFFLFFLEKIEINHKNSSKKFKSAHMLVQKSVCRGRNLRDQIHRKSNLPRREQVLINAAFLPFCFFYSVGLCNKTTKSHNDSSIVTSP